MTTEPTRYIFRRCLDGGAWLDPNPLGDWVKWDDFAALKAERDWYRAALERISGLPEQKPSARYTNDYAAWAAVALKRPLVKPPHFCKGCGQQLCRVEVRDTKLKADMGHVWVCYDCDERTIGYGDPNEYDGKPKEATP